MSLLTDSVFIKALQEDEHIVKTVGGRIYGQAIPMPDEYADNVHVPYLIVSFDGLTNDVTTKDASDNEGQEDHTTISITICAPSNETLHVLAESVRFSIREAMADPGYDDPDNSDIYPLSYDFSTGPMHYDPVKPCYWMKFTYVCVTNR